MNNIKKFIASASAALIVLGNSAGLALAAIEPWNVAGNYNIGFQVTGDPTVYTHDAQLTQTGSSVDGVGGYPAGVPHTYAWDVTSGAVSGNTINLTVIYTLGAVGTVMNMTGTIASDGTMSGTWTDNFGGSRAGTWQTSLGAAVRVTPEGCGDMTFDNVIEGTSASNYLIGTSGRDLIIAKGGSDYVDGKGGDDCILGGDGSDSLSGGAGNDVILGQDGSDAISGGLGDDNLLGGADSDSLKGEGGNDTLNGQGGSDAANGGAGTSDSCTAEAKTQCEL
jgi:Ca2+-binding RTX toxin-like protein